ncbi:hypothetical protein [Amycolatopsis sp. NPDC059657]|uniref:hypothetical protein n=1 Tax=Amycolatopsis sp. NPDC059657 TaxID=3346899 RepID=UPI003671BE32
MTEQTTTTPEITPAALADMRDVLERDLGYVGAERAPEANVIAKIATTFGSVQKFLDHYGH